jgi:hypothetical protein
MRAARQPRYELNIEAPANGKVHKATITVVDKATKQVCYTDQANLLDARERKSLVKRMAQTLKTDPEALAKHLEESWNRSTQQRRQVLEQAAAGAAGAAPEVTAELLDSQPDMIDRPLRLAGDSAYAATWCQLQVTVRSDVNAKTGTVTEYNPPLVRQEQCLLIVRDDGQVFSDAGVLRARPLAELGLSVCLEATPVPGREWSGAGVKRYQAGDRPKPVEVFGRVVSVVDRFIDFSRSLDGQTVMCELVACYILATYLLDAFHVVGYLWPTGEAGAGKTTLLEVVTEMAYLGQVILAGGSYPTLRDLAGYGATLAFDDAEAVMDTKRTDPDKRTLLLAGNRKGATVSVKELKGDRWVTRHINTFCPRLFSAIRLPDQVLGSRCIIVPLVRSGDDKRSKATPKDPTSWPCDRRRLVDDLWALGLANLRDLPAYERAAAEMARLSGRNLEPWRNVLAVAHWLEARHGVTGLFGRMEGLSVAYQAERGDYEDNSSTRVLFRALLDLTCGQAPGEPVELKPGDIAKRMNEIADTEDLAEPDKPFTNARKVGWLLKRQRFRKGERTDQRRTWKLDRGTVESAAQAHGVEVPGIEVIGEEGNVQF